MNSIETLRLQALKLKQLTTQGSTFPDELTDHLISKNPEVVAAAPLRNICAFISRPLFDEIETMCSNLSISKRRFVEMALIDLLAKANEVVEEVQPFEGA